MSAHTDVNNDAGNVSTNETVGDPEAAQTVTYQQVDEDEPIMEEWALYLKKYEEDEGKPKEGDTDLMAKYKEIVEWEKFKEYRATVDDQVARIMFMKARNELLRDGVEAEAARTTFLEELLQRLLAKLREHFEQTDFGSSDYE